MTSLAEQREELRGQLQGPVLMGWFVKMVWIYIYKIYLFDMKSYFRRRMFFLNVFFCFVDVFSKLGFLLCLS